MLRDIGKAFPAIEDTSRSIKLEGWRAERKQPSGTSSVVYRGTCRQLVQGKDVGHHTKPLEERPGLLDLIQ